MSKIERILIIDDDEEDRDFFCQAVNLIDPTIKCSEAIDGADGLKFLSSGLPLPSCIFLDINMPRISGIQFLKIVKEIDGLKQIPIAIYSTSKHPQDKDESTQLGAIHFITKPTSLGELRDSICYMLEKGREQSHSIFQE
jgi:DNA-binding NtrC family response regulator